MLTYAPTKITKTKSAATDMGFRLFYAWKALTWFPNNGKTNNNQSDEMK